MEQKANIKEEGKSSLGFLHREPIDSGAIWNRLNSLIADALKRDGNTTIKISN